MEQVKHKVSQMAEHLIGSEIIKLGGEIRDRILKGEQIYNFTIGDFDPNYFQIPEALTAYIIDAYRKNLTNYPVANGAPELRQAIVDLLNNYNWLNVVLVGGDFNKITHPYIYFDNASQAKEWLINKNFVDTYFLIKGSRSMQMEKVLA